MIIKINKKNAGQRLDKFLAGSLDNLSRSQIQKLIIAQLVSVNDMVASPHYNLKSGDIINLQKKLFKNNLPVKNKNIKIKPIDYDIPIIDETNQFLVINKPAGLAVHGTDNYTLADWLKAKYPKIKNIGDDPDRPGIVHRLDKDVSGLMIIAKTKEAFDQFKKQFQHRTIVKEYTALVHGKIQKDQGIINFPIKRAKDGYKMAAMPLTVKGEPAKSGRLAETQFWIKARLINYTLLKIKIRTGRTHQIRVHLAAYDHPVVGDNIYATAKARIQNKKIGLNRIFLVADHLNFIDTAGKQKNYNIDLTEELTDILKIVK
jgi:23S rRNA pseudouridine1911/1915/1917 synthase